MDFNISHPQLFIGACILLFILFVFYKGPMLKKESSIETKFELEGVQTLDDIDDEFD